MLINPTRNTYNIFLVAGSCIALLFGAWACSRNDKTTLPQELQNVVLESPMPVTKFELTTQRGTIFSVNDFKNKWTFLFFGYTNCPDVCPTTLTELTQLAKQLDSSIPANDTENHQQNTQQSTKSTIVNTTAEVQYVFVTVDPQRDTQQHLAGYLNYFNQGFIGLTGSMDNIEQLAGQLKIKHARGEGSNDNYTVNHSSAILLIDPQGRYYAKFSAPHYAENLRSKLFLIKQHFHRFS